MRINGFQPEWALAANIQEIGEIAKAQFYLF